MLSIVIVNWNTGKRLAACLFSLAHLPDKALIQKIWVVDNNSSDTSLEEAKAVDTGVLTEFISLPKNGGFARANNVALRKIQAAGLTHVFLLNPDTEVRAGAIRTLLTLLDSQARAGIVGPKLLNVDGSIQPSVRRFPTLTVFLWLFLKLSRLWVRIPFWKRYMETDFDYERSQRVDQVMGAAFLIRDEALTTIGLLDENFWIWFEEVDYCKRARAAGWEVWFQPVAEVVHYGGVSFNQLLGARRTVPFLNSAMYYVTKHHSILARLILSLFYSVAVLLSLPASIFHYFFKRKNYAHLNA